MLKNLDFSVEPQNHQYPFPNEWETKEGESSADCFSSAIPFILILGNDKDTSFLFKTAFEIWNYDVAEANNCEQCFAISTFKAPDLILIDSEIDFQKTLTMMKSLQKSPLFKDSGFIFISGHAQANVRQTALSAGANFFLLKPIDFAALEKFAQNYFRDKNLSFSFSGK
jgi:CheY-like chemotaxis protein